MSILYAILALIALNSLFLLFKAMIHHDAVKKANKAHEDYKKSRINENRVPS